METEKFDLKQLLEHFSYIGETIWGQTLQINRLERILAPVRKGEEELSLKPLKAIQDDCAFLSWWKMPEISEEELKTLEGVFSNLEPHDEKVITKLFEISKNIEITSCILRLVDP